MKQLPRFRFGLGLALAIPLIGLGTGCEKDPPSVASPALGEDHGAVDPAPQVVVEDPGVAPTPASPDPQSETQPSFGTTTIVATKIPCQTDADCGKSSCCHATTCAAASDAPDCSAAICTMECRAGTMDCNGGCLCQAGVCAAKLWRPPQE